MQITYVTTKNSINTVFDINTALEHYFSGKVLDFVNVKNISGGQIRVARYVPEFITNLKNTKQK